jgi:hypothetical protein
MGQIASLPVISKPFNEMTQAEMLIENVRLSLMHDHYVLTLPDDPEILKAMGFDPEKVHNRKSTISQHSKNLRVKVDDGTLRHQEQTDLIAVMREKLRNIKLPSKDD